MRRLFLLALLPSAAQELYVAPASFSVSPGERVAIAFQHAGRVDAVRDATLVAGQASYNITNLRVDGSAVTGDANAKSEGTLIVYAGARGRSSAKALLLSGRPGPGFDKRVGLLLELVPEANPYTLKSGDALPLLTLRDGKPAACAVNARTLGAAGAARLELRSDAAGRVVLPLKGAGKWLISATAGDGLSTTLSFEIF